MKAFHSTWTKPFFAKHQGNYEIEDFELLTTILSALKWQELNGDIQMVTDEVGAHYYQKLGLEKLWNLGIDRSLGEAIPEDISPTTFWAAGKLYALEKQQEPCVMLDTDFIIWETLNHELISHDVTVIHQEELDPAVYPDLTRFKMNASYTFPKEWDWSLKACNTAFTYFKNVNFKNTYVDEAKRFMLAAQEEEPLIYMVFAEQRLLAMCAQQYDQELYHFATTNQLFHSGQRRFTHVWGHKRLLRENRRERILFCKRCIARITKDYPKFAPLLREIEVLRPYFK